MKFSKIKKFVKNPYKVVVYLGNKNLLNWLSDERYIKMIYKARTGKTLNLKNPSTYNEKLQWLKLYNRNSIYTQMVDKYEVRNYIKNSIGEKYLIPLIGQWDNFNDINFEELPMKFILKCNHDSGGLVVCLDKNKLDLDKINKRINKSLKRNYYNHSREWPYKNIKPKIICEEFIQDEDGKAPMDYKFYCFNGEIKLIQVDIDRFGNHKQNFYDENWNFKDIRIHCENDKNIEINEPINFNEMKKVVKKLAKEIPHVRVDLYNVNGKIYFGELTFFHMSGMTNFKDEKLNEKMGEWIYLPNVNIEN
ncbi:ATP-grasp fold amidoligase family protein [uncultured Clostridium sp.]|uniref:ATP-grasp fold amidoligase family protein n=1 Tax=uncultured Clostridium sp. TaxID=59620 RepID=UPI00260197DF|nr:ATP-grasp fold amidoligase family protein [uncultured Clostridium sp.]